MRAKSNIPRPGRRELRVAENVAQALPAAYLAQLEAAVDDSDNRCPVCEKPITGATAEVVAFAGLPTVIRLAHTECLPSGIYSAPGIQQQFERGPQEAPCEMLTLLGLRQAEPRPLLFLEPTVVVSAPDQDPLEPFAHLYGLSPVSGSIEGLAPPRSDALTIGRCQGGLALRHLGGTDFAPASRPECRDWLSAADEALVIVARGLGLDRVEPTIEEALRLRPAWAAIAPIEDVGAARRLARTLLRRAA